MAIKALRSQESMNVTLNAIKTAGVKDRKAILAALANTKNFDGVLGTSKREAIERMIVTADDFPVRPLMAMLA